MAFFDDLGRAISGATQTVAQRGRDFSDANRFNSMISNEERAISYAYSELGRLYIEKYEGKYDEEMAALVNSVKESQARIEDFRKRVQVLKNIQVCPQCGMELKRGAFFCPSCGFKLPEMEQMPPMGMNPVYDTPMGSNTVAFGNSQIDAPYNMPMNQEPVAPVQASAPDKADKPVNEPEVAADTAADAKPSETPKASEQPVADKQIFCSNCGALIESGNMFCITCGTPV